MFNICRSCGKDEDAGCDCVTVTTNNFKHTVYEFMEKYPPNPMATATEVENRWEEFKRFAYRKTQP